MDIFHDDSERERFREHLLGLAHENAAEVCAWCLMGNHFHAFISVTAVPVSSIIHRLLTSHAQVFNERSGRKGHLFQERHRQRLCMDEAYYVNIIRYIHQNPVRAGLTEKASDWRWSSAYGRPELDDLLPTVSFDPWPRRTDEKPFLLRGPSPKRVDLDSIAARAGFSIDALRFKCKSREIVASRRDFARLATKDGASPIEIARWLGLSPSALTDYLSPVIP